MREELQQTDKLATAQRWLRDKKTGMVFAMVLCNGRWWRRTHVTAIRQMRGRNMEQERQLELQAAAHKSMAEKLE